MRIQRIATVLALLSLITALPAITHDLFLRPATHHPEAGATLDLRLLNGSFVESENSITADRVVEVRLVGPETDRRWKAPREELGWDASGTETPFSLAVGDAGHWVVGVATRPRDLALAAADFNDYLEHDGIPDVLEARRRDGELDRDVVERYSKHVKTLLAVGDEPSAHWSTPLGFPAEIVPLSAPRAGEVLEVRCLVDGEPVADQYVRVGRERGGTVGEELGQWRTDQDGLVSIEIPTDGLWFVQFIHMVPAEDSDVDYESNWATLTFEVR
jgi:hypothetical protein